MRESTQAMACSPTRIDANAPNHGPPELAGLAVTVTVHLWWHHLLLSLVTGTAVCLALAN